jgi:hypothetical protein
MKMRENSKEFRQHVFFVVLIIAIGLYAFFASAEEVKIVRLNESSIAKILISARGTVLSFPAKPTKVILGRSGSFGIEYVENDLAISPLNLSSRSNLFVYLLGRRFAFDLVASQSAGSSVVQVRDAKEKPQIGSK